MVSIRQATFDDCSAIAHVQVDSYRCAYAGQFPQTYLDHFTYAAQEQEWHELLASGKGDILLVAEDSQAGVIGYLLAYTQAGLPGYDAEIAAMHVREEFRQQGIGSTMLNKAVGILIQRGCHSAMLWTLRGSPARAWYERLRGKLISGKTYPVYDQDIVEVAYGWNDIHLLITPARKNDQG
jgi:ribosomal protein S18 acetylase RimI-like enzyme